MVRKKGFTNADIGACLREARTKAGLTQAQLGEKMGASFQSVSHYETGAVAMTVLQLMQAAVALECKTLDLIPK